MNLSTTILFLLITLRSGSNDTCTAFPAAMNSSKSTSYGRSKPQSSSSTTYNHSNKNSSSNNRNRVIRNGVSGAVGGVLQVITLMWLRTLTSYQYRHGVSMTDAAHELYNDGGIGRFYKGWQYALLQGPLSRFGSVASNELATILCQPSTLSHFNYFPIDQKWRQFIITSIGAIFVTIWRAFLMPIDTCKTVAQVEGSLGLTNLVYKVCHGNIYVLYEGTWATILGAFIGHWPWFLVYNYLESTLSKPINQSSQLFRHAFIGFISTAISDIISNSMRVIKTVKQSLVSETTGNLPLEPITYISVITQIYKESGIWGIFGRGLGSRLLSNGLQV